MTDNVWQQTLKRAESMFSPQLYETDQESAYQQATYIAQEIASGADDTMLLLLVCNPDLLTREPWAWEDVVESRKYVDNAVSPFWLAQQNIKELVEKHLEKVWDERHGFPA